MFERFSRSWALAKASAGVLRDDKELLILPVVSGISMIVVAAAFIVPAYFTGLLGEAIQETKTGQEPTETMSAAMYVWMFAFYLVQYFVIIFFNTALVGAALMRLDGGNPTLGTAFALASSRIGTIAGYAVISATVGVILRFIGERFGFIGRIVESLLGFGWAVSTFLVIPIIAAKGIGPVDAVKQSGSLLRKSFGENIIGSGGIGLVFTLLIIATGFVGFALAAVSLSLTQSGVIAGLLGMITVLAICGLIVFAAALGSVYSAAVYRYADGQSSPRGFDGELLSNAFHAKKSS